jgi:transcription elongation factor Elf1
MVQEAVFSAQILAQDTPMKQLLIRVQSLEHKTKKYLKELMTKNIEFGCPKCDRMFNSITEMDVHFKEHSKPKPIFTPNTAISRDTLLPNSGSVIINKDPVTLLSEKKSIDLTYVFKGNCPTCGIAVTTLELDVASKHIVVAVCTRCNKQLATQTVAKLYNPK